MSLPESRLIALKATSADAESCFRINEVKQLSKFNRLIPLQIGDIIPLKTENIQNWPLSTKFLCLHCSETIPGTPLPAVKYYDSHDSKFWVYGFFCRPCCCLAYVQEHPNTDTPRCIIWTQAVLRNIFKFENVITPAPPRCALEKYGGKLTLEQFYGTGEIKFKSIHNPPFVTFAMYAEMTNISGNDNDKTTNGLRRPTERTTPIAKEESTQKTPLILEFLAKRGISMKGPKNNLSEPIKKKRVAQITNNSINDDIGGGGSLARYLVRE